MAVFSDALRHEVRLERMHPEQVQAAKAACPAIHVPVGSIEWHGYHNPVGLDAVKAHELLVGLASRVGGVVYPAVFFGAGGGHTEWPSSFMVRANPMQQVILDLLCGFERDGYRKVILLSGHYPNASEILAPAAAAYREGGGAMDVLVIIENQVPGVDGDHAARVETSFMLYLLPELVDVRRLHQDEASFPLGGPDEAINWMVDTDPGHPCFGLVGIDPRAHASAELGCVYTERLLAHLAAWVECP